jgi:alpha-glucosidase
MLTAYLFALVAQAQEFKTTGPNDPLEAPPAKFSYSGFYTKCAYFKGLPIVGSPKVDDKAFHVLIATFGKMLANVPDAEFEVLPAAGSHYSILASTEGQTDLPEYANMKNDPKTDWNKRARGLGGFNTSAAEENILELPVDRYKGESIYIHEFAHTLARYVFPKADPDFRKNLQDVYDKAMAEGLWKNTYSATNKDEYFAEGVQAYFDCCRSASPANGIHNEVCTRDGLEKYDPRLFALVDKAYGHNPWRYEGTYNSAKKAK